VADDRNGIGQAANLALATLPNFIYPNDIVNPSCFGQRTWSISHCTQLRWTISVPSEPGLGVKVNEKFLEQHTIGREVIRM